MNLPEIAWHLVLYAFFLPAVAMCMGVLQSQFRKNVEEVEALRLRLAEAEREIAQGRGLTAALAERLLAHEKAAKSQPSWNHGVRGQRETPRRDGDFHKRYVHGAP